MKKALLPILAFAIICILGNSMFRENRNVSNTSSFETAISSGDPSELKSQTGNENDDTLRSLLYSPDKWLGTLFLNSNPLKSGTVSCNLLPNTTFTITGMHSDRITSPLILTWTGSEINMNKSPNWIMANDTFKYTDPKDTTKILKLTVCPNDTIAEIGILIVGTTFTDPFFLESAEARLPRRK